MLEKVQRRATKFILKNSLLAYGDSSDIIPYEIADMFFIKEMNTKQYISISSNNT